MQRYLASQFLVITIFALYNIIFSYDSKWQIVFYIENFSIMLANHIVRVMIYLLRNPYIIMKNVNLSFLRVEAEKNILGMLWLIINLVI